MLNIVEAEFARELGVRVRTLRTRAALSQQDLADRASLSRQVITSTERGARMPRPLTIRKLARALHVKPEHLTSIEL